jgi:hypothetical protein
VTGSLQNGAFQLDNIGLVIHTKDFCHQGNPVGAAGRRQAEDIRATTYDA